jgi:hypothetical protein
VVPLPVGFAAGAATDDVHPGALLGNAYQPLVSRGVGLILFEAGLRLRPDKLRGRTRRVVRLLVVVGPVITGGPEHPASCAWTPRPTTSSPSTPTEPT